MFTLPQQTGHGVKRMFYKQKICITTEDKNGYFCRMVEKAIIHGYR